MGSPHKGRWACDGYSTRPVIHARVFKEAYRNEDAFRQELLLAAILLPLTFWLEDGAIGRALMVGSVLLGTIAELLNSAVEAAANRISFDDHPLAKRAKDIGSAAVLLSLINLAAIWLLVLVLLG